MKKLFFMIVLIALFLGGCSTSEEVNKTNDNITTMPSETVEPVLDNEQVENIIKEDISDQIKIEEEEEVVETPIEDTTSGNAIVTEGAEFVEKENDTSTTVHKVNIKNDGFDPTDLTINAGDTIVFKNIRNNGNTYPAIVIGGSGCERFQSETIQPGESYKKVFTEASSQCTVVDGIMTRQYIKIKIK